jgi:threonyl-tRNA synthetase
VNEEPSAQIKGMDELLYRQRHSAAHILAEAVLTVFPEAKYAIGPPIENGFYYDFDLPRPLTPDDLEQIDSLMRESIAADKRFVKSGAAKDEARKIFRDQPYKLELIDGLDGPVVGICRHGDFTDLCGYPHVESTGKVGQFKLTNVAGAYWRGDEHNLMLQRIYGVMFPTEAELQDYLHRLEEAERRDHRRLGRELGLFVISDQVGAGLPIWGENGAVLRQVIEDFWKQLHREAGYRYVYSPHIGLRDLWETSGHLSFYAENMYSPVEVDEQQFFLKPVNCPFHIQVYKRDVRSYRDLPLRYNELGTVYRYERSGVLHGLLRVRGFTQDDSHIFCRPDQLAAEINGVLELGLRLWRTLGFHEYQIELAVRDPNNLSKYMGTDEQWVQAEAALEKALVAHGLPYERVEGEAVFYAPKIDVYLVDALGRQWQCSTIQVDFNLPDRFDLAFIGDDGAHHRPFMVHRALLGSLERFFGVLIEHYGGAFPVWLAPVQATLIPIADRHIDYCREVAATLRKSGLRVDVDERGERMQAKIRDAQLQKGPYMLIAGDRDAAAGNVSVRTRNNEDLGPMSVEAFMARALTEVQEYK